MRITLGNTPLSNGASLLVDAALASRRRYLSAARTVSVSRLRSCTSSMTRCVGASPGALRRPPGSLSSCRKSTPVVTYFTHVFTRSQRQFTLLSPRIRYPTSPPRALWVAELGGDPRGQTHGRQPPGLGHHHAAPQAPRHGICDENLRKQRGLAAPGLPAQYKHVVPRNRSEDLARARVQRQS